MPCENKENNKEDTMENGNNKRAQLMSNDECESVSGKSPEIGILGIRDTLVTSIFLITKATIRILRMYKLN